MHRTDTNRDRRAKRNQDCTKDSEICLRACRTALVTAQGRATALPHGLNPPRYTGGRAHDPNPCALPRQLFLVLSRLQAQQTLLQRRACATARLAQPAERKALNLVVAGSSPTVGAQLLTFGAHQTAALARLPSCLDKFAQPVRKPSCGFCVLASGTAGPAARKTAGALARVRDAAAIREGHASLCPSWGFS